MDVSVRSSPWSAFIPTGPDLKFVDNSPQSFENPAYREHSWGWCATDESNYSRAAGYYLERR
jgi:hypothetical protein